MMRRKKVDPNAPPPPPRDNGLPPKPPELAVAQKAITAKFPGINFASGFGFASSDAGAIVDFKDRKGTVGSWRIYAFTDDVEVQLPEQFQGFAVERRAVPRAFVAPRKWP